MGQKIDYENNKQNNTFKIKNFEYLIKIVQNNEINV